MFGSVDVFGFTVESLFISDGTGFLNNVRSILFGSISSYMDGYFVCVIFIFGD